MEVARRDLGRAVFADAPWPRLGHGDCLWEAAQQWHRAGRCKDALCIWTGMQKHKFRAVVSHALWVRELTQHPVAKAGCRSHVHFKEIVSLISTCAGLLEEVPATESSLDYGASHLCCLTEVIPLNVCNAKLMLGGSFY